MLSALNIVSLQENPSNGQNDEIDNSLTGEKCSQRYVADESKLISQPTIDRSQEIKSLY